jgi:hypothetical protein
MAEPELFRTAPKEVVDYFDRRASRPSFAWDEIAPREHALAFTVARTAGFDVIDDLRSAVREAVGNRESFEAFRARLTPILQAKGWWGEKRVIDPRTGEIARVQLGSPRRLALIYDANIRSAEAAGDWERIQRVKDVLPLLEYLTSTSERKRPLHLTWVGTTLPVDDPWWATHYPPNGWRCKCRVRSRAAPREGAATTRPPLNARPWSNRATGETRMVPAGIDPGWDTNPGLTRDREAGVRLVERLDAMSSAGRRKAVVRLRSDPVLAFILERSGEPAGAVGSALSAMRWPVAVLPDRLALELGVTSRMASLTVGTVEAEAARGIRLGLAEVSLAQDVIDSPETMVAGRDTLQLGRRVGDRFWRLAVTREPDGQVIISAFAPDVSTGD